MYVKAWIHSLEANFEDDKTKTGSQARSSKWQTTENEMIAQPCTTHQPGNLRVYEQYRHHVNAHMQIVVYSKGHIET